MLFYFRDNRLEFIFTYIYVNFKFNIYLINNRNSIINGEYFNIFWDNVG